MSETKKTDVDVLSIGAHPDDIELACGGLLIKLVREGRRVVVLDLTRGEMGSRGDAEQRTREAEAAAAVMGVMAREEADLPDSRLANTTEQQRAIIPYIRTYRPKIICALMAPDRHPDHAAAHALSRDANYYSGLKNIDTGQPAYRAPRIYYFYPYTELAGAPPCVVDISDTFETKMEALRAYQSQFHNPQYPGPSTYISSREFWDGIETRARYWGGRIGTQYGEPLYTETPLMLDALPGLETGAEE